MNDITKQLLQSLVNSKQWEAVKSMAEETIVSIKSDEILKDTSEETFKAVALQEGQIRGIKRLLDNIFLTITK